MFWVVEFDSRPTVSMFHGPVANFYQSVEIPVLEKIGEGIR